MSTNALRHFLLGTGLLLIVTLAAWLGWTRGRNEFKSPTLLQASLLSPFMVSGSSMVPTLHGPSYWAWCEKCDLRCLVDVAARDISPDRVLCSHCGRALQLDLRSANRSAGDVVAGDVVEVRRLDSDATVSPGDLVAATQADLDQPFVKRVVAVAGDTIDVASDGRHLTVNSRRIEDVLNQPASLPQLLVDDDRRREVSRWSPLAGEDSWSRDQQRSWMRIDGSASTWLRYHHQAIYEQNRPSAVLDDYQYNVAESRQLQPVDRFSLSGICQCVGKAEIEVSFWSTAHSVVTRFDVGNQEEFESSYYQAVAENELPVDAHHPVAIRVTGSQVILSSLVIRRWVEYRLRDHDGRDRYPLEIEQGQLFLLGDNVPVSVDSRDFGPLSIHDLLGTVTRRGSSTDSRFGTQ